MTRQPVEVPPPYVPSPELVKRMEDKTCPVFACRTPFPGTVKCEYCNKWYCMCHQHRHRFEESKKEEKKEEIANAEHEPVS